MILRWIYRALLRLKPARWREEMLATFDDARADARGRGWWEYLAFTMRELGGLMAMREVSDMKIRTAVKTVGLGLAGLCVGVMVGWVVWQISPRLYESSARLRTTPAQIPAQFVMPGSELTVETLRQSVFQSLLSHQNLVDLIKTYDLYASERRRMQWENLLQLMQRHIELKADASNAIVVAFSYPNRYTAQKVTRELQKVTRELMTRTIDEAIRTRSEQGRNTVEFLTGLLNAAALQWDSIDEKLRKGGPSERLQLERDLAKRRYETLHQQLGEAEAMTMMQQRGWGPSIEVVNMPSLASGPEFPKEVFLAKCGLIGLVLGFALPRLARLFRRPPAMPETATA